MLQVTTCRVVGSRKVAIPKMDDSVEKLEECGKNHVLKLADITDYAKKQDPPISLQRGLIRHVTCGEPLVMQLAMIVNSLDCLVLAVCLFGLVNCGLPAKVDPSRVDCGFSAFGCCTNGLISVFECVSHAVTVALVLCTLASSAT